MATDDERREVARRLRRIKDTREGCGHDMCCDLWVAIFDSDYRCTGLCDECEVAVLDSLADLIEPPTQCPYYRSDRHYCSIHDVQAIDREALRALADEMEQAGKDYRYQMVENACCDNLINDAPDDFIDYARRIREALGVEP